MSTSKRTATVTVVNRSLRFPVVVRLRKKSDNAVVEKHNVDALNGYLVDLDIYDLDSVGWVDDARSDEVHAACLPMHLSKSINVVDVEFDTKTHTARFTINGKQEDVEVSVHNNNKRSNAPLGGRSFMSVESVRVVEDEKGHVRKDTVSSMYADMLHRRPWPVGTKDKKQRSGEVGLSTEDILKGIKNSKEVPGSTTIVAVPEGGITPSEAQMYQDIVLLDSFINIIATQKVYDSIKKKEGEDNAKKVIGFSDPQLFALFMREWSDAAFEVITKTLAGILNFSSAVSHQYDKEVATADLRLDFIGELFGSFGFGPMATKGLSGLISSVIEGLKQVKASYSSESEKIDHVICVYYFEEIKGTTIKDAKLRLFHLHIDRSSWNVTISTACSSTTISRTKFHMDYEDFTTSLSPDIMSTHRSMIRQMVIDKTKINLEDAAQQAGVSRVCNIVGDRK